MRLKFKEDTHQYFNEKGEEYISVSHLTKKLEKVDWDTILIKKARKLKIKPEELRAEWNRKKDLGTQAGTLLHQRYEQELLNSIQPKFNNVECSISPCSVSDGFKWSHPIQKLENNTVYPEAMIYDHDLRICGQSDKVFVVNNTIYVSDFKTDKTIEKKAFSSEWVEPNKLGEPCSHLDDCNFNKYSLKMSMYMYMLWKQNKNLKIGDLILEWCPLLRDEDGIPILDDKGQPQQIDHENIIVPYKRKEVKDIFEYYKLNKL